MIADCVDESGNPAVLIRADTRETIIRLEARPGQERPAYVETYNDCVNKTEIMSKGVCLAWSGDEEMIKPVRDLLRIFAPLLERDGLTDKLMAMMTNSLFFAGEHTGADRKGMLRVADLLVGVRDSHGNVQMLRVLVKTPGMSYGNVYHSQTDAEVQRLDQAFAVGLDLEGPNAALDTIRKQWFGHSTAGHSMDVVGAMMEEVINYELVHDPNSRYINDRATYILVSRDGIRQLSELEVARLMEARKSIVNSGLDRIVAVAEYEKATAPKATDTMHRSKSRNPA